MAHLGITPQKPLKRSTQQNADKVNRYLRNKYPRIAALARRMNAEIWFGDEAGISLDDPCGRTWGACGKTPVINVPYNKSRVNIISAVSTRGDLKFKIVDGNVNDSAFIDFLEGLVEDCKRPIVLIMDNASFHKTAAVRGFVKAYRECIRMFFLPPYSPELNPDESVWRYLKGQMKRLVATSKAHMKTAAERCLTTIAQSRDLVRSFFESKDTKYSIAC
jgi:transposase